LADLFLTLGTFLRYAGLAALPFFALPLIILLLPKMAGPIGTKLSGLIDRVSGVFLWLAMVFAGVMVAAQLAVIIGRYVFGWSASWLNESVVYSFAIMFLLGAASALRDDAHVRVDILRARMAPKVLASIELAFTYLFIFPICWLILWAAISPSFISAWTNFQGSRESDGLPLYFLFRTLIPLFAVILAAQGLSQAIKAALGLRGLREIDRPGGPEHGAA